MDTGRTNNLRKADVPPSAMPAVELASRSQYRFPDSIFIPDDLKGTPLPTGRRISVRLANVFAYKKFKVFGDMDGWRLSAIARLRNCGSQTIRELTSLIESAQGSSGSGYVPPPERAKRVPAPKFLTVQPACRELDPYILPLSIRAARVLQIAGIKRLGDLDGVDIAQFLAQDNCGGKTVCEIQNLVSRAECGEFNIRLETVSPLQLVSEIDKMFLQLDRRVKEVLLLRFGVNGRPPATLARIGKRFGITRERVRQIVNRALGSFFRRGGPASKAPLDKLAAICEENVLPLTPGLLRKWAGRARLFTFEPVLYARAIAELRRDIPVWPEGQEPLSQPAKHLQAISGALECWLQESPGSLLLPEAFRALRAIPGHGQVTVSDFLLALKTSRNLGVQFQNPDQPKVRLKRRRQPAFGAVPRRAKRIRGVERCKLRYFIGVLSCG